MSRYLMLCGTRKGLFSFTSTDRRSWQLVGPFLKGQEVNHAVYDRRSGRIFATENNSWFGCNVAFSDNLGQDWSRATTNPGFAEESGFKLERIWHIEPARASEPGRLFAGVAPAALFSSEDNGNTWSQIRSLTDHPSRPHWHPGAGGLCLHSIVVDPTLSSRLFVGISAVGVFRSDDDGRSWQTANRGTRAEFLPDKRPEFGQCVHKLLQSGGPDSILYQQNHCGVYRSANAGESWDEITAGLPSDFGFPLALHPRDSKTLFVLPLQGAEFRCPPEGKLRVFRSRDGGNNWTAFGAGLPQENAFLGVLREGMSSDTANPAGVYFGTNTGKVYGSIDEGETWSTVADNLPPVFSVSISEI